MKKFVWLLVICFWSVLGPSEVAAAKYTAYWCYGVGVGCLRSGDGIGAIPDCLASAGYNEHVIGESDISFDDAYSKAEANCNAKHDEFQNKRLYCAKRAGSSYACTVVDKPEDCQSSTPNYLAGPFPGGEAGRNACDAEASRILAEEKGEEVTGVCLICFNTGSLPCRCETMTKGEDCRTKVAGLPNASIRQEFTGSNAAEECGKAAAKENDTSVKPPKTGGGWTPEFDLGDVDIDDFLDILKQNTGTNGVCGKIDNLGALFNCALTYIIFPAAGFALFLMILWGAYKMVNGSMMGSQSGVEAGRRRIIGAILGFLLLAIAYWLWRIVEIVTGVKITG